jgi:FAD/FMN-containing dehydrogenase
MHDRRRADLDSSCCIIRTVRFSHAGSLQRRSGMTNIDSLQSALRGRLITPADPDDADLSDTEANVQWTRGFLDALQPFARDAVYVNYLGIEGADRVKAAYGDNYDRLVAVKTKYDPTNLFRFNQNIAPRPDTAAAAIV